MDTMTLEQFGASVRWKYPAYSKYSNKEIAERVIAKYPQYTERITDLAQPEKKGLLRKGLDILTSSTQKFGESIGQTIAAPKEIEKASQTGQMLSNTEVQLRQQIRKAQAEGRDTTRLERALSDLTGEQTVSQRISDIVPVVDKSNKRILGEALGTAVEASSGGILSGTKGFGLARGLAPTAEIATANVASRAAQPASRALLSIGKTAAKDIAQIAPFGYAIDVARNLEEDKSGASIFKPGAGTAVSAIIPLALGGAKVLRMATASALERGIAPNLSGVPSGAYARQKTGGVQELLGKVTPESALDDARASASAFKSSMYKAFGKGKEELITEFTGKRIGLEQKNINQLQKIADRFGFGDRLPQNMQNLSAKETMDLLAEINKVRPVKEFDDPLVRSLKLNLQDVKTDIVKRATKEFGGEGGSFSKIYADYASKSQKLKDIQSIIGKVGIKPNSVKLTPIQHQTATRRLQKIFNDDANGYFNAIRALEDETGINLIDRVAASQLSRIAPKSFGVRVSSIPGVGGRGLIDDLISIATFPLSSPRANAWLIRKIGGYEPSIATKLLNASPKVRKAIYDAVNKENMAFSDAVELYAKDYLKNPKLGLAIEDINKPLLQEARKYKSAEDFVNSQSEMKILGEANGFRKSVQGGIVQKIGENQTRIYKNPKGDYVASRMFTYDTPLLKASGKMDSSGVEITYKTLDEAIAGEKKWLGNNTPLITKSQLTDIWNKANKADLDKYGFTMNVNRKVYRGEGKGIGNSTLVNGQYFAGNKEFASQFGSVTEYTIPKGAKVFDLDKVKSGDSIIPQEMLVDSEALTKHLIDNGFDYTKNTNTRGVEFVKLNKLANELNGLAKKSKSLEDFKKAVNKNYDKYRPEIARLEKNYTKADISRLRSPIKDIWDRANKK